MSREEDIVDCAKNVALFDTLAALLSAFVIIPAVFAYGLNPASGPPLMFITMPEVFKQMPGGPFFMVVFFAAVLTKDAAIFLLSQAILSVRSGLFFLFVFVMFCFRIPLFWDASCNVVL